MKRVLTCMCFIALGWASATEAGGINLAWGTGCWEDNPASLQTFACDSNSGSATMTASFVPNDVLALDLLWGNLDLQSDSPNLPDWWQLSAGACRSASLSLNADFSAANGNCAYVWPGQALDTVLSWRTNQFPGYPDVPPTNRVRVLAGVSATQTQSVVKPSVEYYAFSLTIDFQKSSGVEACSGCSVPLAIVLNQIVLRANDSLTTPLANTCLRWQAAGATPCSATPARNATWGSIKSMYR